MSGHRLWKSGKKIKVDRTPRSSGGEGSVYSTDDPKILAKIYYRIDADQIEKLTAMIRNPPSLPSRPSRGYSFTWPSDLVLNKNGECVGYVMPCVEDALALYQLCVTKSRQQYAPGFTWRHIHTALLNFALLMRSLHQSGHVIGDISLMNVLIDKHALVTLIDTDSWQLTDRSGRLYPCLVRTQGFTPPEVLSVTCLKSYRRTELQDRFGLAVTIFYGLFGTHPFRGYWKGWGEPPNEEELIQKGIWVFGGGSLIPTNSMRRFDAIHPELQSLFSRSFGTGIHSPKKRPSADDWVRALRETLDGLSEDEDPLGISSQPSIYSEYSLSQIGELRRVKSNTDNRSFRWKDLLELVDNISWFFKH